MIELAEASILDLEAMREILNEAIVNTTSVYDESPRSMEYMEDWFRARRDLNMPVMVAYSSDTLVGFGSYGPFRRWEGYKFTVEHSIYIRKDIRGQGLGSQLMQTLIERARLQGMHSMIAGVDASNEDSIRFHEKFGFERGTLLREVGFKFGRWLDLMLMQLIISDTSSEP